MEALFGQINRASTGERVADALRAAILRGDLAPGTPLREDTLRQSASVSRTTVREALRLLSAEGLVTHSAFRGMRVRLLTADDVADIFRSRRTLELAGIDAAGGGPAPLHAATTAAERFASAVAQEDWGAAFDEDICLHAALVSRVGSTRLDEWFLGLLRELRLGYLMFGGLHTESSPADREEHRRIAELLAAGRPAECRRVLDAHLERSEQLLLELMRARTPTDGKATG